MDSILLKYERYYSDHQTRKVFNDILGFRAFCDGYDQVLEATSQFRIADMTKGKHEKHLVELKRELNNIVGYKGVQLVTISRPTAYGEYAPYHFVDTEQEFKTLVIGLRP